MTRNHECVCRSCERALPRGEHRRAVRTTSNHSAPGTLLGTVTTTRGRTLCVFEYDQPAGMVHISDPRQIMVGPHDFDAPGDVVMLLKRKLREIRDALAPGYLLALGARHPDCHDNPLVVTNDDIEHVNVVATTEWTPEREGD